MQDLPDRGRHRQRQPNHPQARPAVALCEWYWARHRAIRLPLPAAPAAVTA